MKRKLVILGLIVLTTTPALASEPIHLSHDFYKVTPERLYNIYTNPVAHQAFASNGFVDPRNGSTIAHVNITLPKVVSKSGEPLQTTSGIFSAANGLLFGQIFQVTAPPTDPDTGLQSQSAQRKYVVVQSWRDPHFGPNDADSTLTIVFKMAGAPPSPEPGPNIDGAEMELTHVNVVESLRDFFSTEWNVRYFKNIEAYLLQHPTATPEFP